MIEARQNRPGQGTGYHESHGLTSRTGNAFNPSRLTESVYG
jgi:hypothetical protein